MTLHYSQRHDREIKVRLNEADEALLKAFAAREGIPLAVLARMLIKRHLRKLGHSLTQDKTIGSRV